MHIDKGKTLRFGLFAQIRALRQFDLLHVRDTLFPTSDVLPVDHSSRAPAYMGVSRRIVNHQNPDNPDPRRPPLPRHLLNNRAKPFDTAQNPFASISAHQNV